MRSCWIDAGNDADLGALVEHGISAPVFDVRDPRVTLAYFGSLRDHGFAPGVYIAASWFPELTTGGAFADRASKLLEEVAPGSAPDFPTVDLDIETHRVAFVTAALTRWRAHRPRRVTRWTLEGMQGGLFLPAQAAQLSRLVDQVCPQAYTGSMVEQDAVAVALDLAQAGFLASRISVFYDAAQLPAAWSGTAFTQGRLP